MSGQYWIDERRDDGGAVAEWGGLSIVTHPHPALSTRCEPIETIDASVRLLAVRMAELMRRGVDDGCGGVTRAIGLAANQVNVCQRLIVVDIPGKKSVRDLVPRVVTKGPLVLINPVYSLSQLVAGGGENAVICEKERCVSYPGEELVIARRAEVFVTGLDARGEQVGFAAGGLLSRCIQHCVDLLDGLSLGDMCDRGAEMPR